MPTTQRRARTKRGKRKLDKNELARPAEEQALRLQEAITKRITRNPPSGPTDQTLSGEAPGFTVPPADSQGQAPSGVTFVSIESDSDCPLSPSNSEGADTSTAQGAAGTTTTSEPACKTNTIQDNQSN